MATANNRIKEVNSRLNELDGLINISNALVEVTKLNIEDANSMCALQNDEYSNQNLSRYYFILNQKDKQKLTSLTD